MKTRNDFVSNSSSSSFILQDAGFFEHFGITADDIRAAILDLYGGKERQDKMLAYAIKHCEDELARDDLDDWNRKYYTERKEELLKNGLGNWVVYDMVDPKEREECYKKWDDHFSWWIAPNEGEASKWNEFEDILDYPCDFHNIMEVINGESKDLKKSNYDRKIDRWSEEVFPGGAALVKHVKESLGVKTMKEVLHDKKTTLMIHFDDNEVYSDSGMSDKGKADVREYNTDKENAICEASEWESEMYSTDRFFEILIKYFIKKGKINLADPELLDFWLVPEDHWWKTDACSKYKDKKYFTDSDETATWQEVVKDMLYENSIMHEG